MLKFHQLMLPILETLKELGGSGTNGEIYETVIALENFDETTLVALQNSEENNQLKLNKRLGWARSFLKKTGYLENSSRGVWALTDKGRQFESFDPSEVTRYVTSTYKKRPTTPVDPRSQDAEIDDTTEEALSWQEQLHSILIEEMSPDAFERLTKRMLRESGFVQVEVTGKTGDGGIDGKGIAMINGLLSFHIIFQCKKYKGSVGSSDIRNFRGTAAGRASKSMFITTGSFTKSAIEEANRDGVEPIELIDGEQLAFKLKELALGVKTEMIEEVTIDREWLLSL